MKKIYLLAATALFAFTANAQFEDDFEDYLPGPIAGQSALWDTWSGGDATPEDAVVSNATVSNGKNSIFVAGGNDMLLNMFVSGGQYTWKYNLYLDGNSSGFIGLMSVSTVSFGLQMYHNNATFGTSMAAAGAAVGDPFTIAQNQWVTVTWKMDLDADTARVDIDGTVVYDGDLLLGGDLETVDIWADDANTNFFMDQVIFADGLLNTDEFSGDVFSVYPNPVVNELTIKSATAVDNVTIYDVLGKQVLSVNPDAISPSVDMSALSSGAYLVNVTIGNATKTIKVLK